MRNLAFVLYICCIKLSVFLRYPLPVMSRTSSHDSLLEALGTSPQSQETTETRLENEVDLATFLISRASHNLSLANYFYWYLMVESEDHENEKETATKEMYYVVFKRFSSELVKVRPRRCTTLSSRDSAVS